MIQLIGCGRGWPWKARPGLKPVIICFEVKLAEKWDRRWKRAMSAAQGLLPSFELSGEIKSQQKKEGFYWSHRDFWITFQKL